MDFDSQLDWLYSTQQFGFKLGLESPRLLLRRFKALPAPGVKVVHVAGTNGKGSTCAIAESLARACGYKTGLFTSPHLIDFRERIRVNGEMILREELEPLLTEIKTMVEGWDPHPPFFEITLAMALKYFRQKEVEIIFLETGLGGRLDATNAVPKDVAVLTPIGMDHMQYLGDTLEDIAWEKADIIAPEKPVITAPQNPIVLDVIEEVAIERRARLIEVTMPLMGYRIALEGVHQLENAALATAALSALGIDLRTDNVAYGLKEVKWPGRFERIGYDFVLDGAHNIHAIPSLLSTWNEKFNHQKTSIIFSAVEDKDIMPILAELSKIAHSFHFAPINSPRAIDPRKLPSLLPLSYEGKVKVHETIQSALKAAREDSPRNDIPTLVTGSLYFIGEVKGLLEDVLTKPTSQ